MKNWIAFNIIICNVVFTGRDISPEELAHIFEKFYRSYIPGKTEIKRFGLGLAIVKRVCDLWDIKLIM